MPLPPRTRVDLMLRAFADPVRLRILHLLRDGELCVCDVVAILRLPQPTVSRHLAYLRKAGLVRLRRQRSWSYYALEPGRRTFHRKLLACLGTCFTEVPELQADAARVRLARRRGACRPRPRREATA